MSNGTFSGNPRTEWLSDKADDRDMRLLETFWYLDPAGRRWEVAKGSVVNGASIPRTLWSSVGSPYTGDYRRAAVIHDVAIKTPGIVRAEADTMFYFACLAGGCSLLQAKLLYAGVRLGSWVREKQVLRPTMLAAPPAGQALPGQESPQELEVRALYTELATDLHGTPDDIARIRAAVDRHLGRTAP